MGTTATSSQVELVTGGTKEEVGAVSWSAGADQPVGAYSYLHLCLQPPSSG